MSLAPRWEVLISGEIARHQGASCLRKDLGLCILVPSQTMNYRANLGRTAHHTPTWGWAHAADLTFLADKGADPAAVPPLRAGHCESNVLCSVSG